MKKITQVDVDNNIKDVWYTFPPGGRMTICVLTTQSGFQVVGKSSCVNIEEFDQSLGMKYSREVAEEVLWDFMSYQLMENNY